MKNHNELSNLIDNSMRPLLLDLLLFYDSMKQFKEQLAESDEINKEKISQDFQYRFDELIEILYRQEVIPIDKNISNKLDSKFQKARQIEEVKNMDEDFKVSRIIREGFTWREQVLRPQEVVVKRYKDDEPK